jgi:hypothetical protein
VSGVGEAVSARIVLDDGATVDREPRGGVLDLGPDAAGVIQLDAQEIVFEGIERISW